jgi:hypothetical protein
MEGGDGPVGSPLLGGKPSVLTNQRTFAAAAGFPQDGKGEGKGGEGPDDSPLPGGRPLTPGAAAAGLSTDRYVGALTSCYLWRQPWPVTPAARQSDDGE